MLRDHQHVVIEAIERVEIQTGNLLPVPRGRMQHGQLLTWVPSLYVRELCCIVIISLLFNIHYKAEYSSREALLILILQLESSYCGDDILWQL